MNGDQYTKYTYVFTSYKSMIPSGNFILLIHGNENAFYTFTQKKIIIHDYHIIHINQFLSLENSNAND